MFNLQIYMYFKKKYSFDWMRNEYCVNLRIDWGSVLNPIGVLQTGIEQSSNYGFQRD